MPNKDANIMFPACEALKAAWDACEEATRQLRQHKRLISVERNPMPNKDANIMFPACEALKAAWDACEEATRQLRQHKRLISVEYTMLAHEMITKAADNIDHVQTSRLSPKSQWVLDNKHPNT